jgi:tetratricopeptide (TPR) repeat protein
MTFLCRMWTKPCSDGRFTAWQKSLVGYRTCLSDGAILSTSLVFHKHNGLEAIEMLDFFRSARMMHAIDRLRPKSEAKYYDKLLKLDPYNANSWTKKGDALLNQRRYQEAIGCYDRAVELDPENPVAWNNRGKAFQNLFGMRFDAIACYDKAIELDPEYVEAWYNKGAILTNWGEYGKADVCFDKVIELDSNNVNAWRGKLILNERLIMLNFANAQAWNNKGRALRNLGRLEEAIRAFDVSIEFDSRSVAAWYNKGVALYDLKRYGEAVECYNRATSLDPSFVKAWYAKGLSLAFQARHEDAIKALDTAIVINPKCARAWRAKGLSLRAIGHTFEADVAFAMAGGLGQ